MNYLASALRRTFWFSFRTFFISIIVLSFIVTFLFGSRVSSLAPSITNLAERLGYDFPNDLEIKIHNGKVASTWPSPYKLKLIVPADIIEFLGYKISINMAELMRYLPNQSSFDTPEMDQAIATYIEAHFSDAHLPPVDSMACIQENTNFLGSVKGCAPQDLIPKHLVRYHAPLKIELLSVDLNKDLKDVTQLKSYMLLTRDYLSYMNPSGDLETLSVASLDDVVINKDFIAKWAERIGWVGSIWPDSSVMFFFYGFGLLFLIGFVSALTSTILLWACARLLKQTAGFKKIGLLYLNLFAVTGGISIGLLYTSVGAHHPIIIHLALSFVLGFYLVKEMGIELFANDDAAPTLGSPLENLYACDDPDLVKSILIKNPSLREGIGHNVPLLYYATQGKAQFVQALIDAGCRLNTTNPLGETALHLAAKAGHDDVVAVLLRAGADVNCPNHKGTTPIHLAVIHNHKRVVDKLKESGAHVDLGTALMLNDRDSVKKIIENVPTDLNCNLPGLGCSPLHCAVYSQNPELVAYLLQMGARPDIPDEDGLLPLLYAQQLGAQNLEDLLREIRP